jgi:hypothetical protein
MSGFLYFLAGRKAPPDAGELAGLGLGHLAGAPLACRECALGPEGRPGVLLAAAAPEGLGFYPQRQRWMRLTGGLLLVPTFVGLETAAPPTPADLARPEQIDGYRVVLGDGNPWVIPVARRFPAGTCLPESLALGPDGKLIREVLPAYAGAWRLAQEVCADLASDGAEYGDPGLEPQAMTDARAFVVACEVLALNYRVGPDEVGLLRLLTTRTLPAVLSWFVEYPAYLAAQQARAEADAKKNAAATGGS